MPPSFFGVDLALTPSRSDWRLMEQSGVGSVRIAVNWNAMQPRGRGKIDWSITDQLVGEAADHGIEVLPFVTGTPPRLSRNPYTLPVKTAAQRTGWANFLADLAARYGPDGDFWQGDPYAPYQPIHDWQIWNEQNTPFFADPVSPRTYDRLLRLSSNALHHVDPHAGVLIGGMLGRPAAKPPTAYPADLFLEEMYRAGSIRSSFTGIGLHPYSERVAQIAVQARKVRRVFNRHHDRGKELAITEIAWGSRRAGSGWLQEGPRGQARRLGQMYRLFLAHRSGWNVSGVYWFSWRSHRSVPECVFCSNSGLLDLRGHKTPALRAFTSVAR